MCGNAVWAEEQCRKYDKERLEEMVSYVDRITYDKEYSRLDARRDFIDDRYSNTNLSDELKFCAALGIPYFNVIINK